MSSAIGGYRSNFAVYHGERNAVWTFFKDMPGPLLWLYLPQHVALNVASLFFYPRRGQGKVVLRAKLARLRLFSAQPNNSMRLLDPRVSLFGNAADLQRQT